MSGPLIPPKGFECSVDFGDGRDYSVWAVFEDGKLIDMEHVSEASPDSSVHPAQAAAHPSQPAASE